ncbi:hypothetical protein [Brevundimonas denitrificans]|uniref:hypothetical protein n=1 Tax=Brevundimonas denitrificans TaxID=1443434 RepID=UPI00223B5418|nr:hypothetical protein [Brevundimonas denitrificans]
MASQIAARYAPARIVNDARYLIVPCEAEGCADLAVIWDRLEEQVVDVIDAAAGRYTDEDALGRVQGRNLPPGPAFAPVARGRLKRSAHGTPRQS